MGLTRRKLLLNSALITLGATARSKTATAATNISDITYLSANEVLEKLRKREITVEALVSQQLKKIKLHAKKLNAFITINEAAIERARELDRKAAKGEFAGLLHGLPIALKDDLQTRDMPTTLGSKVSRNWRPEKDATAVKRLTDAGAVILGKTNMTEFNLGATGHNGFFGDCKNPHRLNRISGGASAGSAVAVAMGMCTVALGSDSSGSVRLPASACGIAGYLPSSDRLSRDGLTLLVPAKDTLGILARSMQDIAVVLTTLTGEEPGLLKPRPIKSVRFIHLATYTTQSDAPTATAVLSALQTLKAQGATITDEADPMSKQTERAGLIINRSEFLKFIPEFVNRTRPDLSNGAWEREIDPDTLERINRLRSSSVEDYRKVTEKLRPKLRAHYRSLLKRCDFLLLPTSGRLPYPLTEESPTLFKAFKAPCELAPISGLPAVSVPVGFADGVPIGLQVVAGPNKDSELLEIAATIESTFKAFRRPALSEA